MECSYSGRERDVKKMNFELESVFQFMQNEI